MGDDAVLALVGRAGRDHDHLALGLGQAAGLVHQRVVVGDEGAELVRPVRQREEDVGDEAGFLLHGLDARADVVRQIQPSFGTGKRLMGRSVMWRHSLDRWPAGGGLADRIGGVQRLGAHHKGVAGSASSVKCRMGSVRGSEVAIAKRLLNPSR